MEYVVLVIILAILEYLFFTARTGKARGDAGLQPPAVVGDQTFERYFRVQQNTMEQLIIFLPSIYFFGLYVHALTAAGIGVVFIIARAMYFKAYTSDPSSRLPGMIVTMLCNGILLLGSLIGVGLSLV